MLATIQRKRIEWKDDGKQETYLSAESLIFSPWFEYIFVRVHLIKAENDMLSSRYRSTYIAQKYIKISWIEKLDLIIGNMKERDLEAVEKQVFFLQIDSSLSWQQPCSDRMEIWICDLGWSTFFSSDTFFYKSDSRRP